MGDQYQLKYLLEKGVENWNKMRTANAERKVNLSYCDFSKYNLMSINLSNADLTGSIFNFTNLVGADLSGAKLSNAKFMGALLHTADLCNADLTAAVISHADLSATKLSEAKLTESTILESNLFLADLFKADLTSCTISNSNLSGTNLSQTNFSKAHSTDGNFHLANLSHSDLTQALFMRSNFSSVDLAHADLTGASLYEANFSNANLSNANLTTANLTGAVLLGTKVERAKFSNCRVHGTSVWNIEGIPESQNDLIITLFNEPIITVDDLYIAQLMYLMLKNEKIKNLLDTVTSKTVLILGRFTEERKNVLNAIRDELRKHNFAPIVFDFEKPTNIDVTGTVEILARMARFIIADLTDPSSIPHELATVIPFIRSTPVLPIRLQGSGGFSMFEDFQRSYQWVLNTYEYKDCQSLIAALPQVIAPADEKAEALRSRL